MRIIKPILLGFLSKPYKRHGNQLALTGLWAFLFSNPDVPLTEQEMWKTVAPLFPENTPWDEGVPKERGEVLLVGDCHAMKGIPVPKRQVSLRIGPVAKSLDVYGNRVWNRDRGFLRKSDPQPFLSMPVDFAHAFGGPGYGQNPIGMGCEDSANGDLKPLPNIEDPTNPILSPEDRPAPAGFGPLGMIWTHRYSKIGKYQPGELGKDPPPLPANTDWTFFNQALPDQWLPGMWGGGEDFSLSGFHPDLETQTGHVPRVRVRSFVTFRQGHTLEPVLSPETLWLFPCLSMGIMIHRGTLPIESDDASEIASILLGVEDPGENRSMDHYLAVKSRREEKNSKDISRFQETPLLPKRLENDPRANLLDPTYLLGNSLESPFETRKILAQKMDEVQEKVDSLRSSLSKIPPPPEGSSSDITKTFQDQLEKETQSFKKSKEQIATSPPTSQSILKNIQQEGERLKDVANDVDALKQNMAHKIEATINRFPSEGLKNLGKTREEILSRVANLKGGSQSPSEIPPPPKDQSSFENLFSKDRIVALLQSERDRIGASFPDGIQLSPEASEKLLKLDASIESLKSNVNNMENREPPSNMKGLIRILHYFSPPEPNSSIATDLRRSVEEELVRTRHFRNRNLRGADLSGLDLSRADFSDADVIGVNFTGSNLSGTQFTGAWATYANFSQCLLDRSDFSGANLGCADLSTARGIGTSFRDAFLSGALLIDTTFSEGDFSGAEFFHTVFRRSKIHKSIFAHVKFLRAGDIPFPPQGTPDESPDTKTRFLIEELDFSGSDFTKVLFMNVDFIRSNLSECRLDQAIFLECTGPGTHFDKASLIKSTFPKSTDFKESSFQKADLSRANFRGVNLEKSDFRGATLVGMDGSDGTFRGALLSGTRATKSRFMKADLRDVDARGGDFREALFLKSDLRGAIFSHASLYKAGFIGAQIDATTFWDHALIGKTTLVQEKTP